MLEPNPEVVSKVAQNLGNGWIGNTIGVILAIACGLVWWRSEPKKGEVTESELSAALSTQLQKQHGFETLSSIELLLKDIHLELGRLNEGQEYLLKLYEATFNEKKMQVPVRRPTKRKN
jgi:hypothetical protein